MTNTTELIRNLTLIALLFVGAWGTAGAEETPPPPVEFLDPPGASVLTEPVGDVPQHREYLGEPLIEATLDLWDGCPTPVESTGTWLRRGWWSAEIDAVVMIRKWDRQNLVLASDNSPFPRLLSVGRRSPSEASARLKLGRFLFRDISNRDHTAEFVVMGGNEFHHSCHLDPNSGNNTFSSVLLDRGGDLTFDGASSMDASYASRLNSFEWNYVVTSRMKRDRMELQPDGRWIRRASPGITYHALAGMRYTDLTENLIWTADDIINVAGANVFTGENGLYHIETSNDMFGFQGGGGVTYERDRWSLSLFAKGGVMMNDAKASSLLSYTNPTTGVARTDVGFSKSDRDGSLPLVAQAGITGKYHIRPNISLRAGYEFTYLTAVALATHQIDFTPETGKVGATATPFYHGLTMGSEFYW